MPWVLAKMHPWFPPMFRRRWQRRSIVPKVRLGGGGVGSSSIFGGSSAPEPGAVGLVVLSKREFEVGYCGGCIGDKKNQDRMCIKKSCAVSAHKNNPWQFATSSISTSESFVFICVKGREDLVWTATTLPFETIKRVWDRVKGDRCPLSQWQNFFDRLRGADDSGEHVELALRASVDAAASIRAKGAISPSKRGHSELSPPIENIVGQSLLGQFQEVLGDPNKVLTVEDTHIALLIDYNKRLKVQEQINTPSEVTRRDQDIVEIQNRLGPRDPDEATCSIAGDMSVMRMVIRHMTDVMLTEDQLAYVTVLYDKYKTNLSTFDDYVVKTVQTMANSLIPYFKTL